MLNYNSKCNLKAGVRSYSDKAYALSRFLFSIVSLMLISFLILFGIACSNNVFAKGQNDIDDNSSDVNYSWPQRDNSIKISSGNLDPAKPIPAKIPAKVDPASSSIIVLLNSIKSSLEDINKNISSSQDTLSKMNDKLDKVNENQKDYWNNYVKMESNTKYPKVPFPAWQVFVDQSKSQDSSLSDNSMLRFVDSLTNNNAVKSNLVSANQAGLDGSLYYPLNIGLGKSIPNANALQSSRLNTMLVLQTYKLQLIQVQALNRVTQLLNVLIVNNNQAQSAQLYQLRKIHKALTKRN